MRARIDRHVGYRGSFLLAFSVVDVVYAVSLVTYPPNSSAVNRWFASIAPLWVWAGGWLLAAVICAWYAFQDHQHPECDMIGFQAAISIKIVWGLGCLSGWILSDVAPSAIAIWLVLAFLVWRSAGWSEPVNSGKDQDHEA